MGFKNPEHSILFCIICMIFFFGVASFLLVSNYMGLPHTKNPLFKNDFDPDYCAGQEVFYKYITRTNDYGIDPFDGSFSYTENCIIWVFYLWGFMRTIDFMRIIDKEKFK